MRILCVVALLVACGPNDQAIRPARQDPARSAAAVTAVREARFEDARREADKVLAVEPNDSIVAGVRALARYQRSGEELIKSLGAVMERAENFKALDHEAGRAAWTAFLGELEAVDKDLAIAAADSSFALELCLACWRHDWNRNGEIDPRDTKLFELEFDGKGGELEETDPRRRPTYRFDVGDVLWARAMISFQRGLVELVLAYRWSALDQLFSGDGDDKPLVIELADKSRVRRAHDRFVAALAFSAQEREAYLAETDDDREWLPNPRQKNYAMPLPVDDALYTTWRDVLTDVQRLLTSEEGLSLREAAAVLAGERNASLLPNAYVDLGRMLREPTNIVLDFSGADDKPQNIERIVRGVLGNGYSKTMRPSPLIGRLRHMMGEVVRGEDTLEKKLRYLLWVN